MGGWVGGWVGREVGGLVWREDELKMGGWVGGVGTYGAVDG